MSETNQPPADVQGATVAPATPAVPAPATPAPLAAESPKISLTIEEYQRLAALQAKLAEIELEKTRELAEKEEARIKALADKGEVEKAFTALRDSKDKEIREAKEKLDALEREQLASKKDATITAAIAGADVIPEMVADLRDLLNLRYEAVRDPGGQMVVREKATLRPAADALRDYFAAPASAYYRKSSASGGAGAKGGEARTPTPGVAEKPASFLDQMVALDRQVKEQQAAGRTTIGLARKFIPSN